MRVGFSGWFLRSVVFYSFSIGNHRVFNIYDTLTSTFAPISQPFSADVFKRGALDRAFYTAARSFTVTVTVQHLNDGARRVISRNGRMIITILRAGMAPEKNKWHFVPDMEKQHLGTRRQLAWASCIFFRFWGFCQKKNEVVFVYFWTVLLGIYMNKPFLQL